LPTETCPTGLGRGNIPRRVRKGETFPQVYGGGNMPLRVSEGRTCFGALVGSG